MKLRTFGTPEILGEDGVAVEGKRLQRRMLAVLAILAAEGAAGATRDRLIGLLWSEVDESLARGSLNTAISSARSDIGKNVVMAGATALVLNNELLPSDVAEFRTALERGNLEGAVQAYTAPFLDAVYFAQAPEFERWAAAKREHYMKEFTRAALALAQQALGEDDPDRAVELTRRAAGADPMSAIAAIALMQSLLAAGDASAALDAARIHAQLVRDELDAAPDPRVVQLEEDIRLGRVIPAPRKQKAPAAAAPVDTKPVTRGPPAPRHDTPDIRDGFRSIAVLPFACVSPDLGNEFFAEGITDELITRLMRLGGMRVASRTSVYALRGKDIREIARELDVQAVVEGSVRHDHKRLRITANLIRVQDGRHRPLGEFDRELGDVFAVQAEIAMGIMNELGGVRIEAAWGAPGAIQELGQVPKQSKSPETAARPVSTAAYERFLRGRYLRDRHVTNATDRALALFDEAIALQPDYAMAHAEAAHLLYVKFSSGLSRPRDIVPRIRMSAERALALDASRGDARATLACVAASYDHDWTNAETAFRSVLALEPQNARAILCFAIEWLVPHARVDEALAIVREARRREPLSAQINTTIGAFLYLAGRYDEAATQLRDVLELDPRLLPANHFLGLTELERGQQASAIEALEQAARQRYDPMHLATLGHGYARTGDRDEARAILELLAAMEKERYVSPIASALVLTALGEDEPAVAAVARAVEDRSPSVSWLAVDPAFAPLRTNPAFGEALRRAGIRA